MDADQGIEVPRPSESIQQLKERILRMDSLRADHVFIASTPSPGVYQLTFHGSQEENIRHESWESTRYRMVAEVARLKPAVRWLEASAVVTIDGWVHLDVGRGRWMHMKVEDTRVREDVESRQMSIEFDLDLRGHRIGVLSYRYVAVVLVEAG